MYFLLQLDLLSILLHAAFRENGSRIKSKIRNLFCFSQNDSCVTKLQISLRCYFGL